MAHVGIKGVDRLTQRFNNIANMELKDIVNRATALVYGQAKELAPVGTGGAGLAGSIKMKVNVSDKTVEGRVYTNLEYAPYVEFGTGQKGDGTYPYKIDGLNLEYETKWYIPVEKIDVETANKYHFKKVFGKSGAEYYVCWGQKAQPYMYPALKDNEKTIKKMFKDAVKTKLKKNSTGGQ